MATRMGFVGKTVPESEKTPFDHIQTTFDAGTNDAEYVDDVIRCDTRGVAERQDTTTKRNSE